MPFENQDTFNFLNKSDSTFLKVDELTDNEIKKMIQDKLQSAIELDQKLEDKKLKKEQDRLRLLEEKKSEFRKDIQKMALSEILHTMINLTGDGKSDLFALKKIIELFDPEIDLNEYLDYLNYLSGISSGIDIKIFLNTEKNWSKGTFTDYKNWIQNQIQTVSLKQNILDTLLKNPEFNSFYNEYYKSVTKYGIEYFSTTVDNLIYLITIEERYKNVYLKSKEKNSKITLSFIQYCSVFYFDQILVRIKTDILGSNRLEIMAEFIIENLLNILDILIN